MGDHYGRHEIEADRRKEQEDKKYVKREQKALDAFVAALPGRVVTLEEFRQLSNYSTSYPTGTTKGKLWKTELNCLNMRFVRGGGKTRWIIRQYDPDTPPFRKDDKFTHRIKILQFRPIVRIKVKGIICHDKYEQSDFLMGQAYYLSGMNSWDNSVSEARERCAQLGYNIPRTQDLGYADN